MRDLLLPDKNSLGQLINRINTGDFVIPDFQRPFEWEPSDVCELVKSIFEDYFIGTLLFWRATNKNLESLECLPIEGHQKDSVRNAQYIVLDGQQRLTAMFYAFLSENNYPKKKKRCFFFIKLDEWLEGNFEEAFIYYWGHNNINNLILSQTEQVKQGHFPLSLIGKKQKNMIKWFDEYEEYRAGIDGEKMAKEKREIAEEKIDDILDNYSVSFISLDKDIEVAKVCDIFTRLNSTGIKLTIFDLMNAILTPKGIKLRKLWEDTSSTPEFNLVDSDKMKIYILQIISILKQGYCSPKYLYYLAPGQKKSIKKENGKLEKVVLIENSDEFHREWEHSIELSRRALSQLCNPVDFGVVSNRFFPYPTIVPILSALLNIQDCNHVNSSIYEKIRIWYWSSIFTKNYSSSVETTMTKDYYEMQKWFIDNDAMPQVVQQVIQNIQSLNLEKETSQSSAIYKAVFNILIKMGASDWVSKNRPEYSVLNDHHIIPNSWGKKNGLEKEINTVLNRTPLSEKTNKEIIHDELPNIYLKKLKIKYTKEDFDKLMNSHLISDRAVQILLRENFSRNDFLEFIEERKKTIITEIKKLVGDLSAGEELLEDANEVLKEIEIGIRDFIDTVFKENIGLDYWAKAIPHVNVKVSALIASDRVNVPYMSEVSNPRKKLDYLDMSEYSEVILNKNNWIFFEKYFLNKENTAKHFKHLCDFRNPEKHVREQQEVIDKLGEAAIMWLKGIISNVLDKGESDNKGKPEDDDYDVWQNKFLAKFDKLQSSAILNLTDYFYETGWVDIGKTADRMTFKMRFDGRQINPITIKADGRIKFLFDKLITERGMPSEIVNRFREKVLNIFTTKPIIEGHYNDTVYKLSQIVDKERLENLKMALGDFIKDCKNAEDKA